MSSVEKEQKRVSRRRFVSQAAAGTAAAVGAGLLAGCSQTPQIIKETVEVPVEVIKEVTVAAPAEGSKEVVSTAETVYEIVSPLGYPTAEKKDIAPRLDTLSGKTICVTGLDFRAQVTGPWIQKWIKERYPDANVIYDQVAENHLARVQELGCDAVIIGNGG